MSQNFHAYLNSSVTRCVQKKTKDVPFYLRGHLTQTQ